MAIRILTGDALTTLRTLPDASVNCCVTSPPYYGLRDYGMDGQIGLEETPAAYVAAMVAVLGEVRRVLKDDGTLWLNVGDSYAGGGGYSPNSPSNQGAGSLSSRQGGDKGAKPKGIKPTLGVKAKDLIGIPWLLAFALRADGWYLRKDIIWHKPNPMPESVRDRPTSAHEYVFLLSKSSTYWYDADAIKEPISESTVERWGGAIDRKNASPQGIKAGPVSGESTCGTSGDFRNKRSVWTIATKPFSEAHFATMAPELAETCIKAGCPKDGTVIDPFGGAGTTGMMADRLGRDAVLIELNPAYVEIAKRRLEGDAGMFAEVAA